MLSLHILDAHKRSKDQNLPQSTANRNQFERQRRDTSPLNITGIQYLKRGKWKNSGNRKKVGDEKEGRRMKRNPELPSGGCGWHEEGQCHRAARQATVTWHSVRQSHYAPRGEGCPWNDLGQPVLWILYWVSSTSLQRTHKLQWVFQWVTLKKKTDYEGINCCLDFKHL